MDLQQHNFSIKHRPEKSNANADALSRITEAYYLEYAEYESDESGVAKSSHAINPTPWECCGEIICTCTEQKDDWLEYPQGWDTEDETTIPKSDKGKGKACYSDTTTENEDNDERLSRLSYESDDSFDIILRENSFDNYPPEMDFFAFKCTRQGYYDIFNQNIKKIPVVANQPI
jgi:hypothetical protein